VEKVFSASDEYHGSVLHVLQVEHSGVLGLLPLDRLSDDLQQPGVALAELAQSVAQTHLGVAEKTHLKVESKVLYIVSKGHHAIHTMDIIGMF